MHRLPTLHRLGVLAVALALTGWLSPAHAQSCTTSWTNAAGGFWNDGGNWSAGVPTGTFDDACITLDGTYRVTLNVNVNLNSLTLGRTTGAGTQTLFIPNTSLGLQNESTIQARGVLDWQGGSILGPLVNDGLIALSSANQKNLQAGTTIRNQALVTMNNGRWGFLGNDIQFINAASGTFELQSEGDAFVASAFGNTFTNDGLFRRNGNAGTSILTAGIAFDNNGTVIAEGGTLQFETEGTHTDATFTAQAGAVIFFNGQFAGQQEGTHTVVGTISGDPAGTIRIGGAAVLKGDSTGAVIDFGGTGFEWGASGTIAGTLTNSGLLRLTTGSPKYLGAGAVLTNEGLVEMTDGGPLTFEGSNSTFNNSAGALFDFQSDADLSASFGSNTVFNNGGIVRKSGGNGQSNVSNPGLTFNNNAGGIVSVESGVISGNGIFNHAAGALIQGDGGTFDITNATFSHLGDTGPGTSPGLLTWETDWTPDAGSMLFVELGGLTPGTEYDQLAVDGDATLGGTLRLEHLVGFAPDPGDSFTVLTANGMVSGSFAAVEVPSGYAYDVRYNAQSVEVEVLTVPNFDLAAVNTDPTGDPVVVPRGGAIDFAYTVTNNTAAPITGDVFFTASLGTTTLAQGVILSGSVPANGSSPVLSFTQPIPGNAPVGTYTYSIKVGQFPNVVVDQVDFTVEVTSGARAADGTETWSVQEATPWLAADGSVLMAAGQDEAVAGAETEAASAAVPEAFGLAAAYPNPFRASTAFALAVPEAARVSVAVYDALGRRVATLLDEEVEAATHRVVWEASNLPSGVYLVRAMGAGAPVVQRVTLVR